MGCILNRERSVPFHSRNGAIPSKTCSIKTPPLLLLFFFFFFFSPTSTILPCSQTGTIFNSLPQTDSLSLPFAIPCSFFPLLLLTLYLLLLLHPRAIHFFFSILRKRRIPLTRTSNQGFLRSRNPSFFSHCRIELSFLFSIRFFFSHIPTLPLFP